LKTVSQSKEEPTSLSTNSPLIQNIIAAIQDKKGENIVSLNLTTVSESIADFFILCDASNITQLKTIADFIEEKVLDNCAEKPARVDGKKGQQWIVLDYVDVVVHCMMPPVRELYQLEELWHDANRLTH
jgi:ribosome-associated protein